MQLNNYPIVKITWADTTRFEGWWSESEMRGIVSDPPSMYEYTTVGYLIHKDNKSVILSPSLRVKDNKNYSYGDPYRFPAKAVVSIEVLHDSLPS